MKKQTKMISIEMLLIASVVLNVETTKEIKVVCPSDYRLRDMITKNHDNEDFKIQCSNPASRISK